MDGFNLGDYVRYKAAIFTNVGKVIGTDDLLINWKYGATIRYIAHNSTELIKLDEYEAAMYALSGELP